MTPMTRDMSNIATSIRSSTAWSRVRDCPYSAFHRDVGAGVFPALIGAATPKRSVSLVSG